MNFWQQASNWMNSFLNKKYTGLNALDFLGSNMVIRTQSSFTQKNHKGGAGIGYLNIQFDAFVYLNLTSIKFINH